MFIVGDADVIKVAHGANRGRLFINVRAVNDGDIFDIKYRVADEPLQKPARKQGRYFEDNRE